MQEQRLKIKNKTRKYRFWYDARFLRHAWKPYGVKGEWHNGKIWVPILDIHTKQFIYNQFFRSAAKCSEKQR